VAATPYQRNLSVRMCETGDGDRQDRPLSDPIIVVGEAGCGRFEEERPQVLDANGHHRLSAMRTLGAKSITAIVVPEAAAAYQILALNKKAHNLRRRPWR
jgi:ParB family chromosome partitioning protein